jgi:hypothetical protein
VPGISTPLIERDFPIPASRSVTEFSNKSDISY